MFKPVTEAILGNPVLAGLAAFSVTSTTLAAASWFAGSAFGRERVGRQSAIGGRLCGAFGTILAGMTERPWKGEQNRAEGPPGSKEAEDEDSSARIDVKALQRELDEAFAPISYRGGNP